MILLSVTGLAQAEPEISVTQALLLVLAILLCLCHQYRRDRFLSEETQW